MPTPFFVWGRWGERTEMTNKCGQDGRKEITYFIWVIP
jgi:hypothetical protein